MAIISANFERLQAEGQKVRVASLEAIARQPDLQRHLKALEAAMNVVVFFSGNDDTDDDDDREALRLLCLRVFNGCSSALELALTGYYQHSAMITRDLLETAFLIDYFTLRPEKVRIWRTADERTRKKEFNLPEMRRALDARDGFTARRRETAYAILCEYAAHPTYNGLQMLRTDHGYAASGPFHSVSSLEAVLAELAKTAIQLGENYCRFFSTPTIEAVELRIRFKRQVLEWTRALFADAPDSPELANIEAELARLKAQQPEPR